MASFWDTLLQTGAAALPMIPGIGQAGALGAGVLQGLSGAFGIADGGGTSLEKPLDAAARIQQLASFTSTGAEGAAANRESAEAARRFIGQQTAEGRLGALTQRSIGSQLLGGAQQTTDLARNAALTNLGNQTRSFMQQGAAAGASPAALAGLASKIGETNIQTLGNLSREGASAQLSGLSQAGQAFSAAEQIRGADLAQQASNFQPYALQKSGGTNLGSLGGYQQTMQGISAAEDPWALTKQQAGKGAGLLQNEAYELKTTFISQKLSEGKTLEEANALWAAATGKA